MWRESAHTAELRRASSRLQSRKAVASGSAALNQTLVGMIRPRPFPSWTAISVSEEDSIPCFRARNAGRIVSQPYNSVPLQGCLSRIIRLNDNVTSEPYTPGRGPGPGLTGVWSLEPRFGGAPSTGLMYHIWLWKHATGSTTYGSTRLVVRALALSRLRMLRVVTHTRYTKPGAA